MKIGLSSYSFRPLMLSGEMQIEGVFGWLAEHGGEHLEIAGLSVAPGGNDSGYELRRDTEMVARIRSGMAQSGVPVSGLCIGASFIHQDAAGRRAQIDRVKGYVELCAELGARHLRTDVVPWSYKGTGTADFEAEFGGIAEACREIAAHAEAHGVIASIENHGFFMNGSERVRRLIHAVGSPAFRLTLDVGNFLCVDEDGLIGTRAAMGIAGFVHFKDFYIRDREPGPGWLATLNGRHIRGSVFGYGDLDTRAIVETVVASGYDGFISLEYEGNEPSLFGCETGLSSIRKMIAEARGAG